MKTDLFFSIVIPTYNRSKFIPRTLSSVSQQTYKNYEVIIVDDGSTDDTQELMKQYISDKIHYIKIPNSERGAARNKGIENAKGDYITFLDSDDILYPDYLKNASESLTAYKNPPFFHLAYQVIDEQGTVIQKIDGLKNDDISIFIKGNPLSCLGVFIRKDITDKLRFVEDRDLSGSEDWELWIRIAANHGIKTDNRISAALVSHSDRSVLKSDEEKLMLRKATSLKYAFSDKAVVEKFGKHKNTIEGHCDSYISLHLALLGRKRQAMVYLIKAILNNLKIFTERRFYSIIKHIIIPH
jgi:glycosyltransferase involved in cell wall biosynthesis